MKSTVLRYGIFSMLTIFALSLVNFFLVDKASYTIQEAAGYLSMFISMIFVFFGIRHYRDNYNGGALTFGKGMKVGILIVVLPALFFGLFDILYTQVINPAWSDHYYNHFIEEAKRNTPPEKLANKLKELQEQKEFFANPFMQFLVMTATVFIVGLIVTILSALTLRKK